MLQPCLALALCAATILACASASALETEPSPPQYKLNRADEDYRYLRDTSKRTDFWDPVKFIPLTPSGDYWLSIGAEARERYEYFNNFNWGTGPQDHGGYFLQRYFLHGDLHLKEHVRLFAQLQSSLETGRTGGPRPVDQDELDLHQTFLDLKLPIRERESVTLRSGRQELAYGTQRIISVREGPNARQSFDGFRAMYRAGAISVDGFATKPTRTRRYAFDDGPDNSEALWGLYSVFPTGLAGTSADLYYLGFFHREARFDQGSARETRHSVGVRLWREGKPLDYNFEFLYQWGSFGSGDIQAWTAASDTGYTLATLPLRPRVALKADIASGDHDPASPDLQTFNPLFPKGAYFSENGLIGPANLIDINPYLELHLQKDLNLTLNWDVFWRESRRDGIYNNSLALVRSSRSGTSRFTGSEPQAQLEWKVDRHMTFVAIYAHFFAGPFLRQSGSGEDVDYATTWLTYKF